METLFRSFITQLEHTSTEVVRFLYHELLVCVCCNMLICSLYLSPVVSRN
jgi:hypothetical protein